MNGYRCSTTSQRPKETVVEYKDSMGRAWKLDPTTGLFQFDRTPSERWYCVRTPWGYWHIETVRESGRVDLSQSDCSTCFEAMDAARG